GKISFGNSPPYPPFSMIEGEKHTGFDIEVGEALGAALGVKVDWQYSQFEQLQPSLDSGRIDAILSGSSDLPERHDVAWYVDYIANGPAFIAPADTADSKGWTKNTDLCGAAVSREFNSTQYDEYLDAFSKDKCVGAGLPAIKMVDAAESSANFLNMRTGRAVAAVEPIINAAYRAKILEPGAFKVVGEPFVETRTAIQVPKADAALKDALAAAMKAIIADGTYTKILEKYGLTDAAVTEVTVNLEPVS
ncbi:transporter substrate-binding domain-containing protein, partial [Acrocarpospora pleiomorpha]